jgi:hypothetical protein
VLSSLKPVGNSEVAYVFLYGGGHMMNSRKKWTPYGENRLIEHCINGKSNRQIAIAMGRTEKAVERKKHSIKNKVIKRVAFAPLMLTLQVGYAILRDRDAY